MAAYITSTDYGLYRGEEIDPNDFDRYAARASEAIDAATDGRIARLGGLQALDASVQALVRLTCCAQAEYYALSGIDAATDGLGMDGFMIGKTQIVSNQQSRKDTSPGMLCQKARQTLAMTGLTYRGVALT